MTAAIQNPFELFSEWFDAAIGTEPDVPDAMILSTATAGGTPDARTVLLKGHDENGFVFFTNYNSAKGQELAQNPKAALTFHWKTRKQQVRIKGEISKTSVAESDAYFASRPRGSQIGAWASDQSAPLDSMDSLHDAVAAAAARFGDAPIPRPDHWGGYRLCPLTIEFWQDKSDRLHERQVFSRPNCNSNNWTKTHLYP
ncbi:MAG: pyridoxamine 5'-phosphate oxidase [Alphaproteobacteria bacterium]